MRYISEHKRNDLPFPLTVKLHKLGENYNVYKRIGDRIENDTYADENVAYEEFRRCSNLFDEIEDTIELFLLNNC